MVYKRYITREGKKFGPYYYESYRDGKGISRTRKIDPPKKTFKLFYFLMVFSLFLMVAFVTLNIGLEKSPGGQSPEGVPSDKGKEIIGRVIQSFFVGFNVLEEEIISVENNIIEEIISEITKEDVIEEQEDIEEAMEEQAEAEEKIDEEILEEQEEKIDEQEEINQTREKVIPVVEPIQNDILDENLTEIINETLQNVTIVNDTTQSPWDHPTGSNITEIINETLQNVTIVNDTTQNITEINQTQENITLVTNETTQNITIENKTVQGINFTTEISTIHYGAVLGKPVKWKKIVKLEVNEDETVGNLTIILPKLAGNISVKKIDAETGEEIELKEERLEIEIENEKIVEEREPIISITGEVVKFEGEINIFKKIFKFFRGIVSIVGRVIETSETQENVLINIQEELEDRDEIEVEYYTDAPYAEEIVFNNNYKEVTIIGPDEVHYENVLAFSELSKEVDSINKINLYWIVNGSKQLTNFDAYDSDENGLYDYIEWVVPSLSNQTYEIILITDAIHLDSNRSFIENVYDLVKERDQNWTDEIPVNNYVRVTFEKNLTSVKDITIYAKSSSIASVEVYEKDSNDLIAKFETITEDKKYQIFLTNLTNAQDTFDLKIVGNPVMFDYIVDPTCPAGMLGSGNLTDPCVIINWTQLQAMNQSLDHNYSLANNLNSTIDGYSSYQSGLGFSPIGNATANFAGSFDGNNYAITDLFINRPSTNNVGLFGYTASIAVIFDIELENVNITGAQYLGGFVGTNLGKINNSYSSGNVTGGSGESVGGFVGQNEGKINNSYSSNSVEGDMYVGGFVGYNLGKINNSYSTGSVTGTTGVGGFMGYSEGYNYYSYSTGSVTGTTNVGGFVGIDGGGGYISNFWNTETAGVSNDTGNSGNISGISGKTTLQMKIQSTFTNWDFTNIWDTCEGLSNPWLRWETRGACSTLVDYTISDCGALQGMKYNLSGNYNLTQNIDCSDTINWNSGAGFIPVGSLIGPFTGSFDGSNYNITNLFINRAGLEDIGLFGITFSNSVISNVGLIEFNITGKDNVGALAGVLGNSGNISNSFSFNGSVNGTISIGGLVGYAVGGSDISNSYSTGSVTGTTRVGGLIGWDGVGTVIDNSYSLGRIDGATDVGGLIGRNRGNISNSFSNSEVVGVSGGLWDIGGLVGWNDVDGVINNSYATGNVTSMGVPYAGGLVGWNEGKIDYSYSTGNVESTSNYVGGLVGQADQGTINNSYSTGNVTANNFTGGLVGWVSASAEIFNSYSISKVIGDGEVGGLVGSHRGLILNSYSCESVNASDNIAGGLIGYADPESDTNYSYSAGVVNGITTIGGFVGQDGTTIGGPANFIADFWDIEVAGNYNDTGDRGNVSGISSNTTIVLNTQSTFVNAGWDFTGIWNIDEGSSYPYFSWQANPVCFKEICNGIDDDKDGQIDEGLGQTTCGVGACVVTIDNCIGGVTQTCTPGTPTIEICDNIDNDCDGQIDEGMSLCIGGGPPLIQILLLKGSFSVNPSLIEITLMQGKQKTENFIITNTGQTVLSLSINIIDVENFTTLSDNSVSLGLGQSETVYINFSAEENATLGNYTGQIMVSGPRFIGNKSVDVFIEVIEKESLIVSLTKEALKKLKGLGREGLEIIKGATDDFKDKWEKTPLLIKGIVVLVLWFPLLLLLLLYFIIRKYVQIKDHLGGYSTREEKIAALNRLKRASLRKDRNFFERVVDKGALYLVGKMGVQEFEKLEKIGLAGAAILPIPVVRSREAYNRGVALYYKKDYGNALKELQKSVKLDNNFWQGYQVMGNCYYENGMKKETIAVCERSLLINPNNVKLTEWLKKYKR